MLTPRDYYGRIQQMSDFHELIPTSTPELFKIPAARLVHEAISLEGYPKNWGSEIEHVTDTGRRIVAQVLKNTLSSDGVVHKITYSDPQGQVSRTIELSLDVVGQLNSLLQLDDERTLTIVNGENIYEAMSSRGVFSQMDGEPGPGEFNVGIVTIRPTQPGKDRRIYQAIASYMSDERMVEDYDSGRYLQSSTGIIRRQPTTLEDQIYDALINSQTMGTKDNTLDELVLPNLPKLR